MKAAYDHSIQHIIVSLCAALALMIAPLIADPVILEGICDLVACSDINSECQNTSKPAQRSTTVSLQEELCHETVPHFSFHYHYRMLHSSIFHPEDDKHLQSFYPTVPTPPPNQG